MCSGMVSSSCSTGAIINFCYGGPRVIYDLIRKRTYTPDQYTPALHFFLYFHYDLFKRYMWEINFCICVTEVLITLLLSITFVVLIKTMFVFYIICHNIYYSVSNGEDISRLRTYTPDQYTPALHFFLYFHYDLFKRYMLREQPQNKEWNRFNLSIFYCHKPTSGCKLNHKLHEAHHSKSLKIQKW
jgi:hypothetical protein